MSISEYKMKYHKISGIKESLDDCEKALKKEVKELTSKLDAIEKAQIFIQEVAKETQSQLKYHISDLVQLALDTCFPDKYTFDINFQISRGKTEAELVFRKDNSEIDPITAAGGGVVDLTAFALRLSAWSLGKSDNVIILDEPLKWLQPRELQERGFEMIKKLSDRLGLQFIISSNSVNNEDILDIADKVFTLSNKNGKSVIINSEEKYEEI